MFSTAGTGSSMPASFCLNMILRLFRRDVPIEHLVESESGRGIALPQT